MEKLTKIDLIFCIILNYSLRYTSFANMASVGDVDADNYPVIMGNTCKECTCGGVHCWFFVETVFKKKDGSRLTRLTLSLSENGYCGPGCTKKGPVDGLRCDGCDDAYLNFQDNPYDVDAIAVILGMLKVGNVIDVSSDYYLKITTIPQEILRLFKRECNSTGEYACKYPLCDPKCRRQTWTYIGPQVVGPQVVEPVV